MNIKFLPKFQKSFSMLSLPDQKSIKEAILLFRDDPHDEALSNHALEKPMAGKRSISAGPDLRIIFRERGDYIEVLMLDVGNHTDVYLR